MKYKRPFVLVKAAMTLDGKIAAAGGDSKWISSEASRQKVHEWRNEFDAVLVGIGTVLKDDPLLTCRIEGGRDPVRVVIDPELMMPAQALCLGERSVVFTAISSDKRPDLITGGTKVIHLDATAQGVLEWKAILDHLGKLGLHSVMVEGGGGIFSSLLKTDLVDELRIFLAPKLLGGGIPLIDWGKPRRIDQALALVVDEVEMISGDVLITAHREE
jgi:diaminohydroxyphosphoribosylaminopyrimidine deaminase/5-amino-6-(5-phosphoribosylamino)uracil reductase